MTETSAAGEPPDERVRAIAVELGALSRRIDVLSGALTAIAAERSWGAAGGSATPPVLLYPPPAAWAAPPSAAWPPQGVPYPTPGVSPSGPGAPPAPPVMPPPVQVSPSGSASPVPVPVPPEPSASRPRVRRPVSGGALLAATGGAVTLLGVVMLLVLAASRGWFSPLARVSAGAVLGLALIGIALRLRRRSRPGSGTAATALAGTGFAALFLSVAAATALYGLLPAAAGVPLALVVATAGLALADRWRADRLALGVVTGGGLLAPAVADGFVPLLVGLVLVLQVAATPVALRRGWPWLALLGAAWPAVFGVFTAWSTGGDGPRGTVVAAGLVALLVGTVAAVAVVWWSTAPVRAQVPAGMLAVAPLPVLATAPQLSRWPGVALAATAAVVLLAAAAVLWFGPASRSAGRAVPYTAVSAAAVATLQTVVLAFQGITQQAVLLGLGLVLAVSAALLRTRPPLLIGAAFGLLGLLPTLTAGLPVAALVWFPAAPFAAGGPPALVTALGLGVLVLALAVAMLVALGRTGLVRADAATAPLWGPVAVVALYGAAGAVVSAALLVSPDRSGFLAGHAVVTVSWTVAALVLLARGIRRPALRVAGMVLVGAAVAKLVLFDLVALDGLARVAAFLGAGLVLLAAGTRYARLVAAATTREERSGGTGAPDPARRTGSPE